MMRQIETKVAPAVLQNAAPRPFLRIQASHGWTALHLRDLWEYRDLLYLLIWRDVKVRYKQTLLGVAWVVLQPVLTTVIFTFIFGNLAHIPSENLPYALFALSGLLPWNFFAGALSRGATSLVGSAQLISKVYFPRLLIPISGVLAGLVDFAIVLVLLLVLLPVYGIALSWTVLSLPLFLLLGIVTAIGVSLWLSALNVRFRDVNYLIPFLVQVWMYVTPVVYPISMIPAGLRLLYNLNPMTGVVEGFRWAVLGSGEAPGGSLAISAIVAGILLISGLFTFRRMERTFADIV